MKLIYNNRIQLSKTKLTITVDYKIFLSHEKNKVEEWSIVIWHLGHIISSRTVVSLDFRQQAGVQTML